MTTRRLLIAANLAFATLLLVLGVVPDIPEIGADIPDVAAHGIAYAAQTVLLFAMLLPSTGRCSAAILAALAAIAYGGLVEGLQSFQPARTVEIRDLGANALGAVVAATLLYLVGGRERQVAADE